MARTTIFTLNARGNVFLEVSRDHFKIKPDRMFREIQGMFAQTLDILREKGIEYSALKTALVPSTNRREIALVFDSSRIESSFYGYPIFEKLLPLFSKDGNQSVLGGDFIGDNQEALYEIFEESVQLTRNVKYQLSNQFFIVYINNLTDGMFDTFTSGLQSFEPYVGFVDTTYASRFKIAVSTMLPDFFLKHRNIVLMGHEDDRDNKEDVNMGGYPFEESGFIIRSMTSLNKSLFLNYKIERPVFEGFESDTEFSLNAIHPKPRSLGDLSIRLDDNKHEYLKTAKGQSLKRIGLLDAHVDDLRKMIADRISSNYIYNMTYDDEHGISKFDILLEVRPPDGRNPLKVMVALEYRPDDDELRVITLY